jgi:hypothetical protein
VYYLDLPQFGGAHVSTAVGLLTAVTSSRPFALSTVLARTDHTGWPALRAVAVHHARWTCESWRHAVARGRCGSGVDPLGYIALSTSGDQSIRGAPSPAEAATLAAIGLGIVAGDLDTSAQRLHLEAGIYIAHCHLPLGVAELHHEATDADRAAGAQHAARAWTRPVSGILFRPRLAAGAHLMRWAPLGSWATQPIFQLVREPPPAGPAADAGLQPDERSIGWVRA